MSNTFIYSLRVQVSGVQYAQKDEMFGNLEMVASVLAKERAATGCCGRGALAVWCSLECRRTTRHG